MKAADALRTLGGAATWQELTRLVSRWELERSIAAGEVRREARGRFALPDLGVARRAAARLSGTVSHLSAAEIHGWAIKAPPASPHVTVDRTRKIRVRDHVHLHWADLAPDEVVVGVTSVRRTLIDCLRTLPIDEALCVADSALRTGATSKHDLVEATHAMRGPGVRRARTVAALAHRGASGPFESVLRAICFTVSGLRVEPQVRIGDDDGALGCPDLVDTRLGLVIEADSFAWHGDRAALVRDARRYNGFTRAGWMVLRFTWEDVMLYPELVHDTLARATAHRHAKQVGKQAQLPPISSERVRRRPDPLRPSA